MAFAPGAPAAAAPGAPNTPNAPSAPGTPGSPGAPVTRVTVLLDDLPISFPVQPFLDGNTTMVPLRALSEALGFEVTYTGETQPITCAKGQTTISLKLADTAVSVNGVVSTLQSPARLEGDTTVVPLRFFSETLGYQVDWDGDTYTATVRSPKSAMEIWGFYALGNADYSSWEDLFAEKYPYPLEPSPAAPASKMDGVILGWFAVASDGTVTDSGDPSGYSKPEGSGSVLIAARANGCKPYAMFFADNQGGSLSALLANTAKRVKLASKIAGLSRSYDGIALDFEGLGASPSTRDQDAQNFTAFVKSLTQYVSGRSVLAILPPLNGAYLGYDHKAVGELVDAVVLMAYGYEDPSTASATAPWAKVDEAIRLELAAVPAEKVLLGVPAYGTVYVGGGAGGTSAVQAAVSSRPAARDVVVPDGVDTWYSPADVSVRASWESGGSAYRAFLEDNRTLQAHLSMAKRYGLRGAAVWRLGLLNQGWWDSVLQVVDPVR